MLYNTFLAAFGGAGYTSCNKKIYQIFLSRNSIMKIFSTRKNEYTLQKFRILNAEKVEFFTHSIKTDKNIALHYSRCLILLSIVSK